MMEKLKFVRPPSSGGAGVKLLPFIREDVIQERKHFKILWE